MLVGVAVARRAARGRAGRDQRAAAARAAARGAARPRRRRAARQRRHAAAQAGRRRGRRARARRGRARAAGARRRGDGRRRRAPCSSRPRARAALLVQARAGDDRAAAVDDAGARAALTAERRVAARLGASCHTAVGVFDDGRGAARVRRACPTARSGSSTSCRGRGGRARRAAAGGGRRRPAGARRGDGRVTVYLVGAGPGDPGLLTVRAAELIARADVILHDRLIPAEALAGARPDAELVYVGKQGGGPQMPQEEIHRLLLEHARAGREVVRLKGGDPFVFGRGGEEALVCLEAGIPFEVVPGVTAGVAAPAYAGIPVTHRELASGVAFVTGHEDPAKPETALDWPALAAFPGTLVFYMGVRALPRIAEQLVAGGRPASEPVAVVERGTLPGQRTLLATLADVAERARRRPASARRRSRSSGRSRRCASSSRGSSGGRCTGASVAVTRARPQASALAARLRELGADVVEAPAIRIEPLDADAARPRRVRPRLRHVAQRRARAVRAARRGGPGRARAGRRARWRRSARAPRARSASTGSAPTSCRTRSVAEGLVEALAGRRRPARAGRPRARGPRRAARRAARARRRGRAAGALRDGRRAARRRDRARPPPRPTTSRSRPPRPCASSSPRRARSTARGSPRSARRRAPRCARPGIEPDLEADPHTPDGLVAALVADAAPAPGRRLGGAMRPITFLSDYGTADEFVGVVHAVIARSAPEARVIDLTHGIPRHGVLQGALTLARALPFAPRRRAPRGRRPRGRRAAPRGRAADRGRGPAARRARQRPAAAGRRALRRDRGRRSRSPRRRGGSSPSRRRSTAATCSRPSPRGSRPARRSPTRARRSSRSSSCRSTCPLPRREPGALRATVVGIDGVRQRLAARRPPRPRGGRAGGSGGRSSSGRARAS